MDVKFHYKDAEAAEPIVFEQIFAEKPGGALVGAPAYDIKPGTALGYDNDGKLQPIKGYKLAAAVQSSDTTIKIEKGSGIASGDVIGVGSKAVASTALSTTNADYDVVTITLGVACAKGQVLYQAAEASADAATPKYAPKYVAGVLVPAGDGDQLVKVVNGANLRKETALLSSEVAALLPTINLV